MVRVFVHSACSACLAFVYCGGACRVPSAWGMHLNPDGTVRKDVDIVIEGIGNILVLREHLPAIWFRDATVRTPGPRR
jgi:hypothetical protein